MENIKRQKSFGFATPLLIYSAGKLFTWLCVAFYFIFVKEHGLFTYTVLLHDVINWDGIWYIKTAMEGYNEARKMVFFPLLPLLIKLFSFITRDYGTAGLLVCNLFSVLGALYLYNLARDGWGEQVAVFACLLFTFSPISIFYSNVYTEPLFFTLSCAFFYFLLHKQWAAAAICAGLASGCRNTGFMLAIPLMFEYFRAGGFKGRLAAAAALLLLSVSGLLAYMTFLFFTAGDPLRFLTAQELWHHRNAVTVPFRALAARLIDLKDLFDLSFDPKRTDLSVIFFTAAIVFFLYGLKKLPQAHLLYFGLFILLFSTQPIMMSLSRYFGALPQFWLVPGIFLAGRKPVFAWLAALVLAVWQVYINMRWMLGYWVA